jgi:hypothetical protein
MNNKIVPGTVNCCECGVELEGMQKNAGRCHKCVKKIFPQLFGQSIDSKEALAVFRKVNGMAPETSGMFASYGPELAKFAQYWLAQGKQP